MTKEQMYQWQLSRGKTPEQAEAIAQWHAESMAGPTESSPTQREVATAFSGVQTRAAGEAADALVARAQQGQIANLQAAYRRQAEFEAAREASNAEARRRLAAIPPLGPGATDYQKVTRAKAVEQVMREVFGELG